MKNYKKGSVASIIIVIGVLLLVAGGLYLYSKGTPAPIYTPPAPTATTTQSADNPVDDIGEGDADFTVSPMKGPAPLKVTFTNGIETAGAQSMDYGDGTKECWTPTPDGDAPCDMLHHTYTKPGTYTAVLYAHLPTQKLAEATIIVTAPTTGSLTPAQIFQEASAQLHIDRNKLVYLNIFGQDRIQYSFGNGTNYAYKLNGVWHVASSIEQGIDACSNLVSVPEQYRPPCYDEDTKETKYVVPEGSADANQSVNYPPAQAIMYFNQEG